MKTASAPLIALLASNQFIMADLLTITPVGGTAARYTSADMDIVLGADTFSAQGVKFKRGRTRVVVGVEVDSLDLTLYADSTHLLNGVPLLAAIHNGAFDSAVVKLERAFMASWGDTSAGSVILFQGRVSDSTISRTEAKLVVKSDLELLNIKMPRNLYQPNCVHTFCDSGCGISKASQAYPNTAAAGTTASNLVMAIGGWNAFDSGTVTFTSGANAGVSRTIKSNAVPDQYLLAYPLPHVPVLGDAFTAYRGCPKTQQVCEFTFNNKANFRGFPYVPTPETAL